MGGAGDQANHAERGAALDARRPVDRVHLDAPGDGDYLSSTAGLLCLSVILESWFGGVRYPGGLPAGLVAMLLGVVIAWGATAVGLTEWSDRDGWFPSGSDQTTGSAA